MIKKSFFYYFWHVSTVFIMVLIFAFSSQSGADSSQTSSGIVSVLFGTPNSAYVEFMKSGMISPYASYELFIRKCAHFLEYTALGFCFASALNYHIKALADKISFALLFCSIYAASDEFHQLFVANRSGSMADVLLDISGIYTGIFLAVILNLINAAVKNKNYWRKKNG